MKINIKATNLELTEAIREYAEKKVSSLEKYFQESADDAVAYVEVAKTTMHHKQGDFFKAEVDINFHGQKYFAVCEKADLYASIDEAREQIERQLTAKKDKGDTMFRRGAKRKKKMMKGLSDRNPFTSKY